MNNYTNSAPILCIDFKKSRFRIHRNTLRLLGNPKYIQLLINPYENILAIRCTVREDRLSHYVATSCFISRNSYELYSSSLTTTLLNLNDQLRDDCSYRFYGSINLPHKIALFALNNAIPIISKKQEEVSL